jgi:hypothetical protein
MAIGVSGAANPASDESRPDRPATTAPARPADVYDPAAPLPDHATAVTPEAVAQLLQAEIDRYDSATRSQLKQIDRVLLSSFSVAGIAAPILLNYHQYAALLAVPIVGFVGFFLAMNATSDMFALAAHKYFVESQLQDLLRSHLSQDMRRYSSVPWDLGGGFLRRRSISYIVLQIAYFGAFIVAGTASLVIAWIQVPYFRWIAIAVTVVSAILTAFALLSFREVLGIYHQTLIRLQSHVQAEQKAPEEHGTPKHRIREPVGPNT